MSELAAQERVVKRNWAAPGSFHDLLIKFLKILLPLLILLLGAYLVLAPLNKGQEISFLLDKNKVEVAKERMRVVGAHYQGQDDKGRPFSLSAQRGLQMSSRDPMVAIEVIKAQLVLDQGPMTFDTPRARYNLDTQKVAVGGPVRFFGADGYRLVVGDAVIDLRSQTLVTNQPSLFIAPDGRRVATRSGFIDLNRRRVTSAQPVVFTAPNGYRLQTGNAAVDLDDQRLVSSGAVDGRMPLGRFQAGNLLADLDERRVVLSGRPRLHIVQGGLR
jgi:lipopolysaccharide export system protein LptC